MSMTCVEFYSWSGQTRVPILIYSLIWYWLNAAVLPHIISKEFLILYKGKALLLIHLLFRCKSKLYVPSTIKI